ncbi:MAG: hypothetical protein ACO2ZZ_09200 [Cyclobacteriaceae bacterium]
MFSFFKINDPYRLIAAYALLLIGKIAYSFWGLGITVPDFGWLLIGERLGNGFVMYRDLYDHTGPLSALTYRLLDYVFGRSIIAHRVVSYVLICFNATLLSRQLVRSRAFNENNYLPGFFYILLTLAIPDGGSLSPMLMSSTFILLALSNVFKRVGNEASDELFLYAGLYLGIASLFYLPAITFFVILLLSLLIFSTAIPRRLFLFFYGLTIPMILGIANYFWHDAFDYFIEQFFAGSLLSSRRFYVSWSSFLVIGGVFLFWLFYSLIQVLGGGRHGNFEAKIIQIMLLVAVAATFSIILDVTLQPAQLYLFLPALAFLLTHLSLLIKKRVFKLAVPILMTVSFIANPYWLSVSTDLKRYKLEKKKIIGISKAKVMVLANEPEAYYVNQEFSGPFLHQELSLKHLQYLDYYETSYQIYLSIKKDRPRVIIDDWQLMTSVFERFPTLAEQYRAGANSRYYLINN